MPKKLSKSKAVKSAPRRRSPAATKFTIDGVAKPSARKESCISLAQYDNMNRLFAAYFPETAEELVLRSQRKLEAVFAGERERCVVRQEPPPHVAPTRSLDATCESNNTETASESKLRDDVNMYSYADDSPTMMLDENDTFCAFDIFWSTSPGASGRCDLDSPELSPTSATDTSFNLPELNSFGKPGPLNDLWGASTLGGVQLNLAEPDRLQGANDGIPQSDDEGHPDVSLDSNLGDSQVETEDELSQVRAKLAKLEVSLHEHTRSELMRLA
ncbi:hypothetical protein QQS21_011163 [Conoideocrella luteorostrata]|uniref:Uncharacterized protein n=1 Tax=Conoideocrella luteorostrata TaxID=1105319 RepID=A0AAJ0FTK1_9HYPO|nr:hypothetical protein QQS21_011163 [Conoideocrella luteorostrata]